MKIAQVVSTPPGAWATGGSARAVYDLSRALVKRGHEVSIFTTNMLEPGTPYQSGKEPEMIHGIKIYRYPNVSDFLAWKYKLYLSPKLIIRLPWELKKYDIVHLQDLISFHAIVTAYYCDLKRVPYIVTPHGSIPWLTERKILNRLYNIFFVKKILRGAKKIIALNTQEFHQCLQYGIAENTIEIIPNGVIPSDFNQSINKGTFRSAYGLSANDKIILFVGRIHKIKGIELLIEAFSDVVKEIDAAYLVIVGPNDGYLSDAKKISEQLCVKEKIIFTGPLYEDQKFAAYRDADVFVLSSRYDTFPLSILEAWASGLPAIMTSTCGLKDLVIEKNIGHIIDFDRDQLTNCLLLYLKNDELRQSIGKKCRTVIETELNFCIISRDILFLYQTVLGENGDKRE